jgi:hypothetical protein
MRGSNGTKKTMGGLNGTKGTMVEQRNNGKLKRILTLKFS